MQKDDQVLFGSTGIFRLGYGNQSLATGTFTGVHCPLYYKKKKAKQKKLKLYAPNEQPRDDQRMEHTGCTATAGTIANER